MSQFVLLWSKTKNDLDIQPLEQYLSTNRLAYKDDLAVDYVPVYVGTRDVVAACAGHCSVTLLEREADKAEQTPKTGSRAPAHFAQEQAT